MDSLKKQLNKLRLLMIEYSAVNMSKDDLKMEVESKIVENKCLIQQIEQYQRQIDKVKKSRKNLALYTGLYYLLNIIIVILNLVNGLFLNNILYTIGSFSGLLLIYLCLVHDDAKILSRNDIRFYKKMIKFNKCKCDSNDHIVKQLDNDLREMISRSYNLNQEIQKICNNIFSENYHNLSINEISKICEDAGQDKIKTLTKKL